MSPTCLRWLYKTHPRIWFLLNFYEDDIISSFCDLFLGILWGMLLEWGERGGGRGWKYKRKIYCHSVVTILFILGPRDTARSHLDFLSVFAELFKLLKLSQCVRNCFSTFSMNNSASLYKSKSRPGAEANHEKKPRLSCLIFRRILIHISYCTL